MLGADVALGADVTTGSDLKVLTLNWYLMSAIAFEIVNTS
jgi:hypothetical protein